MTLERYVERYDYLVPLIGAVIWCGMFNFQSR